MAASKSVFDNKVSALMPPEDLYIWRAFMPGGWLSKYLPGYQMRDGQLRLAQRIDSAIRENRDLIAEGPTGIGKSMAYAVPLAYRTVSKATKAIIVTANIALQEQLINKDLPLLQSALPWPFDFALFKGRNNYLCKDALSTLLETDYFAKAGKRRLQVLDEQEGHVQHTAIAAWSNCTATGDVSELSFEPLTKVWDRFSVTSEDCLKNACQFHKNCHSNTAYKALEGADIVVTNYHIFFAQLALGGLSGYEYVIFDEAHKSVDIARDFFGFRFNENTVKWITGRLHDYPHLKKGLEMASEMFFDELGNHYISGEYRTRLKDPSVFRTTAMLAQLTQAERIFAAQAQKQRGLAEEAEKDVNVTMEARLKLRRMNFEAARAYTAVTKMQKNLELLTHLDPSLVYSLELERERLNLVARKIHIGEDLDKLLFDKDNNDGRLNSLASPLPAMPTLSVTMLSATMAVGGSFDHIMKELGVKPVWLDLFVAESPFDWVRQAKLIVPEDLADPKDRDKFRQEVGMVLSYVVDQAKGRTLGLFTSWAGLNTAYEVLKTRSKYRVLKQGDMPRQKLLEEFQKDRSSVLLGVESFWQGIDVPGDALSCVVIDKLPFPNLDDPILDALQETWEGFVTNHDTATGGPFETYSIPKMVLSVRQGFGRLIRSVSDRGVVVILDRRIHTQWEKYGRILLNSLPPVPKSTDLDDIARFLK